MSFAEDRPAPLAVEAGGVKAGRSGAVWQAWPFSLRSEVPRSFHQRVRKRRNLLVAPPLPRPPGSWLQPRDVGGEPLIWSLHSAAPRAATTLWCLFFGEATVAVIEPLQVLACVKQLYSLYLVFLCDLQ